MTAPPAASPASPDELEDRILARISPSPEMLARVQQVVDQLMARGQEEAQRRQSPMVRCLVAGSAARGTFLKDRVDIDFFLLFPPTLDRKSLEREGLALGGAILTSPETRYAEHPYLRGLFEGFAVDAVPGYAIDDPSRPLSAVDRTPFHQAYLKAHQTPAMIGQVRLSKQFLRGHGLYGSEARTAGFSGYLVELLVQRFGSLRGLLTTASTWQIPVRLTSTPGASPTVPEEVALIVDDPVDPNRNVASALSRRNLSLFILAAAEYLAAPTEAAFRLPEVGELTLVQARQRIFERGTHVLAVSLARPSLVDDILYPQLRKAERAIASEAERQGFHPLATASAAAKESILILLELAHARGPSVQIRHGPPPGIERVGEFLKKWGEERDDRLQGPYVGEDGHLFVETRRAHRELEPILRAELGRLALGRDLRAAIGETTWVRPLSELEESPELRRALAGLLDKRLPFSRATSR